MEYVKMAGIPAELSRLVYGAASPVGSEDREKAIDCLETAYDYGFRVFDTANGYGRCEENIGHWLARTGKRDQVVIFDKGLNPGQRGSTDVYSAETVRRQIALSLQRMQTDHVDFYVLHRDDPSKPVDEIVEVLNEEKARGRILRFGGSNWTLPRLKAANAYAEKHGLEGFTAVSPAYSLAVLEHDPWGGSVTASGDENAPYRAWILENGIPVFPYSSLARSFLSGKYTAADPDLYEHLTFAPKNEYYSEANVGRLRRAEQMAAEKGVPLSAIALAWLLRDPMEIFPITSPSGAKHIEEALQCFSVGLTDEECAWLLNGESEK